MDADTFIRAKRQHYGFDFCPGYWDALVHAHRNDCACSIEPVRDELARGKDDLHAWAVDTAPTTFFCTIADDDVGDVYKEVIRSVQRNSQYSEAAKQKFASGADPWLVAFAKVFKHVIATYEVAAPESKAKIKLPDIAESFDVGCTPPYEMLRDIGAVLQLNKPLI